MKTVRVVVGVVLVLLLASCQPRSNPPPRHGYYGPPPGYGHHPPPQQAGPVPEHLWASYRPPPPQVPPNAQRLGGVRHSFMSPGMCLPGWAKNANGMCVLGGNLIPNLTKLVFPWMNTQGQPTTGQKPVTHATVLVESALINASKHDGRCWDVACNKKKNEMIAKAAAAAAVKAIGTAANPYAAAFVILGPIAAKAWSHPDAAGWAYVWQGNGFSEPVELKVSKNNITPQWGVMFQHVPITPNARLRIELVDADPDWASADDPMGHININSEHLVAAMKSGETHQVHVAKQTHDQVLFVGISVVAEDR